MKSIRYIAIVILLLMSAQVGAQKKESVEWIAKREATRMVLDSMIKNMNKLGVDYDKIQALVDEKCKEMKNDPELMSKIAMDFSTIGGSDDISEKRFRALKKMYPKYVEGYIDHANLLQSNGLLSGGITKNDLYIQRAKIQLDSAKIANPKSMRPYSAWIQWRAPFIKMNNVEDEIMSEVEAWNKQFPDSGVYARAASLVMDAKPLVSNVYDYTDRYDAEYKMRLAENLLEKGGSKNTSLAMLTELAKNYFYASYFQRGANVAEMGLETHQADSVFHSWSLWNNAMAARLSIRGDKDTITGKQHIEKALASAAWLEAHPDKMEFLDYVYTGVASQEGGKYQDAIEAYEKALVNYKASLGKGFQTDKKEIYSNIFECITNDANIELMSKAERQRELISRMEEADTTFQFNPMQHLAVTYENIGKNSNDYTDSERLLALSCADSIWAKIQSVIDDGRIELREGTSKNLYISYQLSERRLMDKIDKDRSFKKTLEVYQMFVDRLEYLTNRSEREKYWLDISCRNLFDYYYQQNDRKAGYYAKMILDLNPDMTKKDLKALLMKAVKKYGSVHP